MTDSNLNIPAPLLEMAEERARQAGLTLSHDNRGFSLSDGDMSLRGDFSRMKTRIRGNSLSREMLVRAARIKGANRPLTVVDATAGLGEDSLLLAAAGFSVKLFERDPVIAVLLASAIEQALACPEFSDAARRMDFEFGDGMRGLASLEAPPDIVLLDPMFPERQKSASVKKKLQLLQRLERPCEDERALLDAAFAARPIKVVVKRPAKGPHLAGLKPDYTIEGKAVRFDCYVPSR